MIPMQHNGLILMDSICSICNQVFSTSEDIPSIQDLSLIDLPQNIIQIEAEAFVGVSCQAIIIPNGCTTIGKKAFAENDNLLYVHIPATVTSIADDAFEGCDNAAVFMGSN